MSDADVALQRAIRHLHAGEVDDALGWYARAAQAGNAQSQLTHDLLASALGGDGTAMYIFGDLMYAAENIPQVIRWYSASAETGHAEAMNALGDVYEWSKEMKPALYWYTQATRAGWGPAMDSVLRVLGEQGAVINWLREEMSARNAVARDFLKSLDG